MYELVNNIVLTILLLWKLLTVLSQEFIALLYYVPAAKMRLFILIQFDKVVCFSFGEQISLT